MSRKTVDRVYICGTGRLSDNCMSMYTTGCDPDHRCPPCAKVEKKQKEKAARDKQV